MTAEAAGSPALQRSRWFGYRLRAQPGRRAPVRVRLRDAKALDTPHMGQFGTADRQAVLHEFGHPCVIPDEYNTRQYMGHDVSGHFDENPFTTNSIMNNTSQHGLLFARHYYSIKAMIEKWRNLPEDSTRVWWPGMLDGKPSKAVAVATI